LGSYTINTECKWYITPQLASGRAADQVILTITKLVRLSSGQSAILVLFSRPNMAAMQDLEFWYDFVDIYRGIGTDNIVQWYYAPHS
jgi:hypothetical protein